MQKENLQLHCKLNWARSQLMRRNGRLAHFKQTVRRGKRAGRMGAVRIADLQVKKEVLQGHVHQLLESNAQLQEAEQLKEMEQE